VQPVAQQADGAVKAQQSDSHQLPINRSHRAPCRTSQPDTWKPLHYRGFALFGSTASFVFDPSAPL
jgi:hypothetical protein